MAPTRGPGNPPRAIIEVSPAYELLLSILVAFDDEDLDTRDLGPEWVDEIRARAGDDLVERVRRLAGDSCDTFTHLAGLVHDTPAPRTVKGFIDHLGATDPLEILLHLVQFYTRDIRRMTPATVIRAAVAGDADARAEFLKTSYPEWPSWREQLAMILDQDPQELKAELIDILELWSERVWNEESLTIMPILERDAAAKRELLESMPLERFIPTATNGVEFSPRPGIEWIVMTPSFVNRPLVTYNEFGDTLLIAYPVADESVSAETDAPPLRLVRLSKALGDEKRLRILRALTDGEKGLMELAEMFGVAKTTMHHHLIVLRSAGLISAVVGQKRYRLRDEAVPDVGTLLSAYLAAPGETPSAAPPSRRRRTGTSG
jgi:DNA-binding transcriptional ArsR family regulator